MTKEVFAQLVLDATDSLYHISKSILRNDNDCEDAVGKAICVGFEKLDTLREDRYAKTWLTRILIHECYAVLRERKQVVDMDDEELQHAAGMTEKNYSELYEALFKMERKYRIPVILFYLEGYSIREIAEILQSTEGTVKSWLYRGRTMLRKEMEGRSV